MQYAPKSCDNLVRSFLVEARNEVIAAFGCDEAVRSDRDVRPGSDDPAADLHAEARQAGRCTSGFDGLAPDFEEGQQNLGASAPDALPEAGQGVLPAESGGRAASIAARAAADSLVW